MEIECKFGVDSILGYTCQVVKASTVKSNNFDIFTVKGIHKPRKDNNDVICVEFLNLKVKCFPRNLQKIFPNLDTVAIVRCGLKKISRQDLFGLEKLINLDLSSNQLKSLPDDLFKNMQNLKNIFLEKNKIEFASSKLIEPIVRNLERLDLRSNTSINECYHLGTNASCATIQKLMAKIDKKCKPESQMDVSTFRPLRDDFMPKRFRRYFAHKIDEKCKPPEPQVASAPLGDSNYDNAEKAILKVCNKFRLLGLHMDFVITVGSKDFPVNKNILASQSSVFAEMFEVKTNGRFASKLEVSEMSQQAVEAFLDYLYERKQPDRENVVEVFKLAAKYEVDELKAICEQIIRKNLNESNAFEVFKLASGKSEELKIAAFRELQETFGLDDNLMNDPESLQKIVDAKKVLDDLMKKAATSRNDEF